MYNDAFIIDKRTKDELIAKDPKSVEIIRPNSLCYPGFQTIGYESFSSLQTHLFVSIYHSHSSVNALLPLDTLQYQSSSLERLQ